MAHNECGDLFNKKRMIKRKRRTCSSYSSFFLFRHLLHCAYSQSSARFEGCFVESKVANWYYSDNDKERWAGETWLLV